MMAEVNLRLPRPSGASSDNEGGRYGEIDGES